MSNDFNSYFINPISIFWQPSLEGDLRQHYRELDAPLTRDLLGAGLYLSGSKGLEVDWDWVKTWKENVQIGALPGYDLLMSGRISVAWLFPFSLLLLYWTGKKLQNTIFGMFVVLLFSSNALILLDTRRAMEESVLTFSICLSIMGLILAPKKPWLVAIAIAIAFNSKQSAIALLPVALISICWEPDNYLSIKRNIKRISLFMVIFISITFLLNPFVWTAPIQAVQSAIQARRSFMNQQITTLEALAPEQILHTPGERFIALIAQLYITPPAIEDVGNYSDELTPSAIAYFNHTETNLFRGFVWGGISIAFTILGLITVLLRVRRNGINSERSFILLSLAYISLISTLILLIPVPFQRYWVPLIPFNCIWIILGLSELLRFAKLMINHLDIMNRIFQLTQSL